MSLITPVKLKKDTMQNYSVNVKEVCGLIAFSGKIFTKYSTEKWLRKLKGEIVFIFLFIRLENLLLRVS